jgi:hypothetical protein
MCTVYLAPKESCSVLDTAPLTRSRRDAPAPATPSSVRQHAACLACSTAHLRRGAPPFDASVPRHSQQAFGASFDVGGLRVALAAKHDALLPRNALPPPIFRVPLSRRTQTCRTTGQGAHYI